MSRPLKIVLIILGTLFLLGGGCVGLLVWWVSTHVPELETMGKTMTAEGEAFGSESSGNGCVTEALARGDRCDGIMCEAGVGIFLSSCLTKAEIEPDFCEGVPAESAILASIKWRLAVCEGAQTQDAQRCGRLVAAIQKHCHPIQ